MVQQVTKGIKISVDTTYKGTLYRSYRLFHNFNYFVTIENTSRITVQLKDRFWKIYDSLNKTEVVEGSGVVGQTPVLQPGDSYTYQSGCFLNSEIGAMQGFYSMLNLDDKTIFRVIIPTFQLYTNALSN